MANQQPSLFSAPQSTDPTGQMSQVAGFNLAGLSPMMGGANAAPTSLAPSTRSAPMFGSGAEGGGATGTSVPGLNITGQSIMAGQAPNVNLPGINFPNAGAALAGLNPANATNTSGLPAPMDMNAVNAALAQMKVPGANLPPPLDPNTIFKQGNMIGPQDTQNLANAIYKGGETLVAPQREQQMIGMREQLAQAGILNSPSGLALERVLNQDQIQQDDALAAQATQTATEVQLSREQLRTNVAAQVNLSNQTQQFQSAMQTQQLQAEMAAQKAGLNVEALSTRFNQQLAVSTLAIQKFFEFGNLMLGAAGLASQGAAAQANYALGRANTQLSAAGLALSRPNIAEQQREAWATAHTPTPSRFSGQDATTANYNRWAAATPGYTGQ